MLYCYRKISFVYSFPNETTNFIFPPPMRKINLLCLSLFGMKQVLSKPILFSLYYYISYVIALISEINVVLSILLKNDDRKLHPTHI